MILQKATSMKVRKATMRAANRGLLLGAILLSGTALTAQTANTPKPSAIPTAVAPASTEPTTPKTKNNPNDEGVTLHGYWKIDVRNPDGTLALHREFENSLQTQGGGLLVGLLSGQLSAGNFAIELTTTAGQSPCLGGGGVAGACTIVSSLSTYPGSTICSYSDFVCTTGLTVTPSYGTNFSGPASLTLAGSFTTTELGNISLVNTVFAACGATAASTSGVVDSFNTVAIHNPANQTTTLPAACAANTTTQPFDAILSGTTITSIPLPNIGSLVSVTVVYSFS